jgi:hypothetical protein
MTARLATADVTLSTKCWEGDYRTILEPAVCQELFAPFGAAARRQVVLNRIEDRVAAQERADALRNAGLLDDVVWAEDVWPDLAKTLWVPETWFGEAWVFSVPELVELAVARSPVVAHLAGDVRVEGGEPWLPRALGALDRAAVVAPTSPSRIELTREDCRREADGFVSNGEFSDQVFVVRRADVLRAEVVRATHELTARYPKPGGALTFEARVGAWLRTTGRVRLIDTTRSYRHPVSDRAEGTGYPGLRGPREHLPPVPSPSPAYPPPGSVDATAVVVTEDAVRTIGWCVASLRWCARVVVVDAGSTDGTAQRAAAAGAEVWRHGPADGNPRALLGEVVAGVDGWIVHIDPDEVVPPSLAHALAGLLHDGVDEVDGVAVARRRFLLGAEVRHAGPRYALTAVRSGRALYPSGIETTREPLRLVEGAVATRVDASTARVVQLGAPGLHAWVARANDATTLEARGTLVPGRNVSMRRAAKRFVEVYLGERAWRTGRAGWRRAALAAIERWLLAEKAYAAIAGGATAVQAAYDELAAQIVSGA